MVFSSLQKRIGSNTHLTGAALVCAYLFTPASTLLAQTWKRPAPIMTQGALFKEIAGPFIFFSNQPLQHTDTLSTELMSLNRQMSKDLGIAGLSTSVRIYLFRNPNEYSACVRRFLPRLSSGGEMRRSLFLLRDGAPHIFVLASSELTQDLRHEFCHAVLNTTTRGLPAWLDEGLAEYYEAGGEGFHQANFSLLCRFLTGGISLDLDYLRNLGEVHQLGALEHALAWSWAHFLLQGPAEGRTILKEYLDDLCVRFDGVSVPERMNNKWTDPQGLWLNHMRTLWKQHR